MKRFLAWVIVTLLVSMASAADSYFADPFKKKPAAKHRGSALSSSHKALAWEKDEKVGLLRGSTSAAITSSSPYEEKTSPPSNDKTYNSKPSPSSSASASEKILNSLSPTASYNGKAAASFSSPTSREKATASDGDTATSAPYNATDGVNQKVEVSAVVVPWGSVTSTAIHHPSMETSTPTSERHFNAEGGVYGSTTKSNTDKGNEIQQRDSPSSDGEPQKSSDTTGQTGRSDDNQKVILTSEKTNSPYSEMTSSPADDHEKDGGIYGRSGMVFPNTEEVNEKRDSMLSGEPNDDKWSGWRNSIQDKTELAQSPGVLMEKKNSTYTQGTNSVYDESANTPPIDKSQTSYAGKPTASYEDKVGAASRLEGYVSTGVQSSTSEHGRRDYGDGVNNDSSAKQHATSPSYSNTKDFEVGNHAGNKYAKDPIAPLVEKNNSSHEQDANSTYDKNANPLSSEERSASYSTTSEKANSARSSPSDEEKHEGGVSAVVVSWENKASKSSGYSSTKAPEPKAEEHHENADEKHPVYDGALGRVIPWSDGQPQLLRDTAEKPTRTQAYGNLLSDIVPWKKTYSLFARDLQSEDLPRPGDQPADSPEQPSEEPVEVEDGIMKTTVEDTTVRWNQDDCDPCEVPTQPPTLAPIYPHGDDDDEKHLPNVTDTTESWKDLNENLPSNPPTKAPRKRRSKPHKDDLIHCTKIIGAYGEIDECEKDYSSPPTPAPTETPTDKTCTDVSVEGDATYCIEGPICSGSGSTPAGSLCPVKGDVAVKDCSNDKLPSWTSVGTCVAPTDATCAKIKTGAWGCVYGEASNTTTNSPIETETPTQTPTETPSVTPADKPYEPTPNPTEPETTTPGPSQPTTYPTEPGTTPRPTEPIYPTKPETTTPGPSESTPYPTELGTTPRPSGPTPYPTKVETTPKPSEPTHPTTSTPRPREPTPYPTEPETITPSSSESTPAPSKPSKPGSPTPAPSQSHGSTPAPTKMHDEPSPTPAASITEGETHPTATKASTSKTTTPPTSRGPNTTSTTTKTSIPSTSNGDKAYANTGGADAKVASTSNGITSDSSSGALSGGAIAGIVIACVIFVAVVVGAVFFKQRSIARQREENLFTDLSATGGRPLETDYAAM